MKHSSILMETVIVLNESYVLFAVVVLPLVSYWLWDQPTMTSLKTFLLTLQHLHINRSCLWHLHVLRSFKYKIYDLLYVFASLNFCIVLILHKKSIFDIKYNFHSKGLCLHFTYLYKRQAIKSLFNLHISTVHSTPLRNQVEVKANSFITPYEATYTDSKWHWSIKRWVIKSIKGFTKIKVKACISSNQPTLKV